MVGQEEEEKNGFGEPVDKEEERDAMCLKDERQHRPQLVGEAVPSSE